MNKLENLQQDADLFMELKRRIKSGVTFPKAMNTGVSLNEMAGFMEDLPVGGSAYVEAVIVDFLRPCLLVKNGSFNVPDSDIWKARLEPYRKVLENRIASVGRIEFKFHPRLKWGGTGWLIAENIIITNRHVAALFANKTAGEITFIQNHIGKEIEAFIDYNEEHGTTGAPVVAVVEQILYLADSGQPDIAILKISPLGGRLEPIPIFMGDVKEKSAIAVIGYPAYDPYRNPLKPADVTRIFNDIFDCKRLSPGYILNEDTGANSFSHDATTLGGNSGSVIIDLKSGQAAGLHFSGQFHEENYAVNGKAILNALAKINVQVTEAKAPVLIPQPKDYELEIAEGVKENYVDRLGYEAKFLGEDNMVSLPTVLDTDSILTFGDEESVLKYLHFSVVMNAKRRMCFYSAVNIFGEKCRKTKRPAWQYDPRIPKKYQIKGECYGNPPKFSRGHMTRREDPAWGDNITEATLGNADSMHLTNTVPQMQSFNAGIWLGLEDHALQHAKGDAMKISVFTGPFFTEEDPEYFGIKIPKEFWKIIAFIHDETGELCATGYTMSQEDFLRREEFVFGAFKTYQTTIKSIQERAGIDFDKLTKVDPYVGEEVMLSPLEDLSQVRFRR